MSTVPKWARGRASLWSQQEYGLRSTSPVWAAPIPPLFITRRVSASVQLSAVLYHKALPELRTNATQMGREQWIHFLVNWAIPILVIIVTHFDSLYFKNPTSIITVLRLLKINYIFNISFYFRMHFCNSLGFIFSSKSFWGLLASFYKYNLSRDEILVLSEWKPLHSLLFLKVNFLGSRTPGQQGISGPSFVI